MKILVLRFSSLGDLIKCSALIERIHVEIPNAEIHFVTKTEFGDLFKFDSRIKHLYLLEKKQDSSLLKILSQNKFDYCIDAHSSLRSQKFTRKLKNNIGKTISINKRRLKKLLLFIFRIPAPPYFLDRLCFNLLNEIVGQNNTTYFPKLVLDENTIRHRLNATFSVDWNKTIALIPGAAWANKELPDVFWTNLVRETGPNYNYAIIGGPNRKFKIDYPRSLDLCGKLSLAESLVFAASCFKVIGVDTGITHGVEALGKDTAIILGPTGMETGAYPSRPDSKIFEKDIFCRPCSKNGSAPCVWGLGSKRCLNLNVKEIAEELFEE